MPNLIVASGESTKDHFDYVLTCFNQTLHDLQLDFEQYLKNHELIEENVKNEEDRLSKFYALACSNVAAFYGVLHSLRKAVIHDIGYERHTFVPELNEKDDKNES